MLQSNGADVDVQDEVGDTALHAACMAGHLDLVRILTVECDAHIDMPNWEGWTPLVWAVVRGHTSVAAFLLRRVRDAPTAAKDPWHSLSVGWQTMNTCASVQHVAW
jgi:ankyrin repeat protein